MFEHVEYDHHERVLFCSDERTGLHAIVAIHNRNRGPAAGGCRMFNYETANDALTDALRLSRGMSYKNALAGLPLGGGKAVIVGDPRAPGKRERLAAFAEFVEGLGGDYWTAIDVGVGKDDAVAMAERCHYVFAVADDDKGRGDTSYFTALGGFVSIEASVDYALGQPLRGRRVAIQGCGATGSYLAELLHEAGAELVVADVYDEAAARLAGRFGARVVDPAAIYEQEVDVFAPCALGAVINDRTIGQLRAKIVCGLANNQLAESRHGDDLRARGILYAPDYVANAGGVIYGSDDIFGENNEQRARDRIAAIGDTLREIYARADRQRTGTHRIADAVAEERMRAGN